MGPTPGHPGSSRAHLSPDPRPRGLFSWRSAELESARWVPSFLERAFLTPDPGPTMIYPLIALLLTPQTPVPAPAPTLARDEQVALGDQNGDGLLDAYLPSSTGGSLFLRDSDGRLSPAPDNVAPRVAGHSAAWRDVDDDGDPDLLVWGADSGHLLLNELGVLRDATQESGLDRAAGVALSMRWLDLDADGREDLVVFSEFGLFAYRSLGEGHFEAFELEGLGAALLPTAALPAASGDPVGLDPELPSAVAPTPSSHAHAPSSGSATRGKRRPVASPAAAASAVPSGTAGLQFGGFCAARIRDAIGGACLQASATPTLGMLMALSTDFNVDPISGYAGFGTTAPETRIHITGGTDVTAAGGGNIQFGLSSGQNIAIDENEIMARDNGTYSSLFVNNDGGNVLIAANGNGRVGIGISHPSGTLHVVDPSGGNGSVVLPPSSISATETEAEAGMSELSISATSIFSSDRLLASPTFNAPTSGYVILTTSAIAHAPTDFNPATLSTLTMGITTDPNPPTQRQGYLEIGDNEATTLSWTEVLPVTAGTNNFYLRGATFDAWILEDLQITMLFVPTMY